MGKPKINFDANKAGGQYTVVYYHDNTRDRARYSINSQGKYAEKLANMTIDNFNNTGKIETINNYYEINGSVAYIYTYNSGNYNRIIIDLEDLDECKKHYWWVELDGNVKYAKSNSLPNTRFMHRFLINATGETVDHINGDGLDNRKCNLREATISQNNKNRKNTKNTRSGGINGVHKSSDGYLYCTSCNDQNGKRHRKSFSINKYGDKEAYRLAVEWRLKKEEEFGYNDF